MDRRPQNTRFFRRHRSYDRLYDRYPHGENTSRRTATTATPGTITRETAIWLRFYDTEGNLVLLPEEAAQLQAENERQKAETERQRAERLAARLRELGEDPESL